MEAPTHHSMPALQAVSDQTLIEMQAVGRLAALSTACYWSCDSNQESMHCYVLQNESAIKLDDYS